MMETDPAPARDEIAGGSLASIATVVFAILVAMTFATFAMGQHLHGRSSPFSGWLWPALIVLAFAKVHLIIAFFMNVRAAPARLRWALLGWLLIVGGVIGGFFGGVL